MQRFWLVSQPLLLLLLLSLLAFAFDGQSNAWAAAQNPFETIGLGALTMIGNAKDIIESGGAVRKEHDMETPFFAIHSKGEAGIGNAMRPHTDDDSEERRRRRKRSDVVATNGSGSGIGSGRSPLKRTKRAPCHGSTTTPSDPSAMAEEIRRQMKARKKRTTTAKRTTSSKKTKTSSGSSGSSSSSKYSKRHRRQTEQDDLASADGTIANVQQKMTALFDKFAASVQEMMQRAQQTFKAATGN